MQEVFENIIEKLEATRIGYVKGIERAIEIVKKEEENYNNGWIPCSERLPDHEKPVFVNGYCEGDTLFIAHYEKESQIWLYESDEGLLSHVDVYAWMPLPEPYFKKE